MCILDRIFQKFKARFYFIRKLALIVSKIEKSNSKNLGLKIGFCNLEIFAIIFLPETWHINISINSIVQPFISTSNEFVYRKIKIKTSATQGEF